MSFLAPAFFLGLAAVAVPILIHLIQRERKEVIHFPSLMFLRRIPYQSVQRRKIHNWLLLLLRCAAIALLVLAFARPFLKQDPNRVSAASNGAREVVILLDHSASMGYGDHWEKAKAAASRVVSGLGGGDRATLVLFATGEEEALRATSNRSALEEAIAGAKVTSDATRYGPALRYAQSVLSRSSLPRKEAVLISDFQKTGWAQHEEIHLPEGATLTPVSVATPGTSNVWVSKADFAREPFSGAERVTVTVLLTNRGASAVAHLPVKLEIDGHEVEGRFVDLDPNSSGSVTFRPVTVAEANIRGVVRAGSDQLPADNTFFFVLSPSRPVSVLVVGGNDAPADSNLFLTTALEQGRAPSFKADAVPVSRVTSASLEHRSVVVLNDVAGLPDSTAALLQQFVEQGGGLFVAAGERTRWGGAASALLPGTLGGMVDRPVVQGRFGTVEYSHPVFELFQQPRNGDLRSAPFYRYRVLTPAPTDTVLARFDDGAVAMAERRLGAGRILAFTSSLDTSWNLLPRAPVFVPLVQLSFRYLAQYEDPAAWYTVGRMLDVSAPVGQLVREGAVSDSKSGPRKTSGVVVAPSGEQTTLGEGGVASIPLEEQGFYSARMQGTGDRRPYNVAVNIDPTESDLTPMEANEFVVSATGRPATVTGLGQSLEHPELTPADVEKKQRLWWFLLFAGVVALLGEALLSNRLSPKFGAGLAGVPRS
jgi:Aerotolerance regulator N-terminal/von Willebrand factor type A domain